MALKGKSVLYGQPQVMYNKKAKQDESHYSRSYCNHTWSYHFVDPAYRQCVNCQVVEYNPLRQRTG